MRLVDLVNARLEQFLDERATQLGSIADDLAVFTDAGRDHTVKIDVTGLNAGTYTATNAILSLDATNSPQLVRVTLVVTRQTVKGRHRGLPLRKPPFHQIPDVGVTLVVTRYIANISFRGWSPNKIL